MQKGVTDSVSEEKKFCLDMAQSEEEKQALLAEMRRRAAQEWIEAETYPWAKGASERIEVLRKKRAQMSEQNK